MNRVDRMLSIVLELQARKQVRAEDLAATFEVSKRTIYRDMMALTESGVPVVSMPGQGYALVEGYFLPPLAFNMDEAIMLMLGSDFIAQNFDAQYRSAAQSARHKIVTVLSDALRREVEYLESSLHFIAFNGPSTPETLQQIRRAILQHRSIRFRYHALSGSDQAGASLRHVDPYALVHIGGTWMLTGHCHSRRDIRHFRLTRMDDLTILAQTFKRPDDFRIQLREQDDRNVTVRALFDHDIVARVRETPSLYQVDETSHADGVVMSFAVRQPADLLGWLLSWGAHVSVLGPASLRGMLFREAEGILKKHSRPT